MFNLNKTLLVTGGAGFIAHHVVNYIINNTNWNVICLDRLDLSGNLNRLHDLLKDNPNKNRVKIVYHDLKAELNDYTKRLIGDEVNFIYHLAAGSHVDRSIELPLEFVMDNVVGTCNILNYARQCPKLERFIYFSTDEVFGPASPGINFKEYDRYNSTNPYSASKAGGEELVVAFHNTYNLPAYITHTMNVYGERQHPEKFIPKCIKKIRDDEVITIHSDQSKTVPGSRFYIHAEDVAEALGFITVNIAIQHDLSGQGVKIPKFNIVGKQEVNNLELAQTIAQMQGKELKYEMVDFHSSRPGHDLRYSLDGGLLRSLGWEPKIDFADGIKKVVDWTLQRPDWLIQ
jgi:dTDP-glucose 4,6-dehydratase